MNLAQVKLQLIEYLSLVIKALASSVRPTPPTTQMLRAIERCADTIAHIGQYDREELQHAFQVEHLSTMASDLGATLETFEAELYASRDNVPTKDDIAKLIALIKKA